MFKWRGVFVKEVTWLGWVNYDDVMDYHATTTLLNPYVGVGRRQKHRKKKKKNLPKFWKCLSVDCSNSCIFFWFLFSTEVHKPILSQSERNQPNSYILYKML